MFLHIYNRAPYYFVLSIPLEKVSLHSRVSSPLISFIHLAARFLLISSSLSHLVKLQVCPPMVFSNNFFSKFISPALRIATFFSSSNRALSINPSRDPVVNNFNCCSIAQPIITMHFQNIALNTNCYV